MIFVTFSISPMTTKLWGQSLLTIPIIDAIRRIWSSNWIIAFVRCECRLTIWSALHETLGMLLIYIAQPYTFTHPIPGFSKLTLRYILAAFFFDSTENNNRQYFIRYYRDFLGERRGRKAKKAGGQLLIGGRQLRSDWWSCFVENYSKVDRPISNWPPNII